jgi:hypothetical protein
MEKKVLSEIALYYGDVSMPKDWEIDPIELAHHILQYQIHNKKYLFSKTWDKLNTYIREHIRLEYDIELVNKKTWGNIYSPHETTPSLLDVDPIDLKHSPDYTLLYGVKVDNCCVKICYDDNKRKGRTWTIPLSNNKFIMFPSTNMYSIINNQKDSLNFIQTITYEFN